MNYYDEEIIIAGPDTKNLSAVKVNRIGGRQAGSGGSSGAIGRETIAGNLTADRRSNRMKQLSSFQPQSNDDDGLLQDIIDHDDDDDTEESDREKMNTNFQTTRRSASKHSTTPMMRPTSSRFGNLPTAKVIDNESDNSESDSDEAPGARITTESLTPKLDTRKSGALFDFPPPKSRIPSAAGETMLKQSSIGDLSISQLDITPDKWEHLNVHQEIKDLFPYILNYTPQSIEVPYRLQPFIPEFVPAVGDVDAFLKVSIPPLMDMEREHELNAHLCKLGLYFLDEPGGEQSHPSLLNMKLRSVLTGSGVNPRLASAALIPTVKSPKDIDKWITEVEQVHMSQSVHDTQPRRDIEPLLMDWPREYALAAPAIQDAHQRYLREDITLADYVRILSERFSIEGPLDTQADYILNVQTLFALYLAANQAWE